ncbi:hypothetical protein F2P56_011456 [Juglans regia]|uniref:Uncharacterized protein n=2 Tax=Juglans regia TaxID=51240 RepID=A0A833XTF1_JUGRE|nr:uncharacterized protein LOC108995405 [Juglans regia]KAF5470977.1 hypothetical protein F2P56_011456 [Juglans regia]
MALVEYGGGGRRNSIFISEERDGKRWRKLVEVMREVGRDGGPVLMPLPVTAVSLNQGFEYRAIPTDMFRQWWSSYKIQGTPSLIFASKLKALKKDLKVWNAQSFRDIGNSKKSLLEELHGLERAHEGRALSLEELAQWTELVSELERMTNFHRRTNAIEMMNIGGAVCSDIPKIQEHVAGYFEQLVTEPMEWRPKINVLAFESIEHQNAIWQERPFEEAKVHEVVKKMVKEKVPRPNGFSMGFFQSCWEVVKDDLMKVKDYRPISLVNEVYKIISEVLANRLGGVLGWIITKLENAFVWEDRAWTQ